MQEKFELIKESAKKELAMVEQSKYFADLRAKYVGKNGEVTALLRGMKDVPADKRSEFGKMVNDLKVEITELFNAKEEQLKSKELEEKLKGEAVDITMPGKKEKSGIVAKSTAKYGQLSDLKAKRKSVLTITTPTMPQAYTECSLLISLSGSGEGIAAIVGLVKTSLSPLAEANTTVDSASPK